MSINIELVGKKELKGYMKDLSKEATKAMAKSLARAAIHVQGKVKISIAGQSAEPQSVDTGRFLNSVGIRQKGSDDAEVFSDLSYAKFLEFGTSRFTARRHFRNTKDREKNKVQEIFDKEVTQNIKKLGKIVPPSLRI